MFIKEVWHVWESKIISHDGKYNKKNSEQTFVAYENAGS